MPRPSSASAGGAKPRSKIEYAFKTIRQLANHERYYFYSIGSYTETQSRFDFFLDQVAAATLKSISYEQFLLPSDDVLKKMAANLLNALTSSAVSF